MLKLNDNYIEYNNISPIIQVKIRDSSSEDGLIYDQYQINLRSDDEYSSDVDRYGFMISEGKESKEPNVTSEQGKKNERKDVDRSLKWNRWVSESKFVTYPGKFGVTNYVFPLDGKFRQRIVKGIPDPWRSTAWYFLVNNGCVTETEFDNSLFGIYQELLKVSSTHERQIDLDIPRTLQSHTMFCTRYGPGQRALFNVLRAFSNYDSKVGYCQGMTNVVTILLMYYIEECAFLMLIKMVTKCNLHNLYKPGLPALMEGFYIQEKLMDIYANKISNHLKQLQIPSTAYATRWYITLFSSDAVPHHTLLRIWDLMMLHGFDVLYFVAVALLQYKEAILLSYDFESVLTMLSSRINIFDDDKLIRKVTVMYHKKGRKQLIDNFKAEYQSRKSSN